MPFTVPMVWPLSPAVRTTDPLSSHRAADTASRTRTRVADAVLWLLDRYGPLTGQQINEKYRVRRIDQHWPRVAWDSPRKRSGEMAADGLLVILNPDDPRGTPHIYTLPEEK